MNNLKYAIQTQTVVTYFKQMSLQEQASLDLDTLDKAYYDGTPLISDSTYDSIRDLLNFKFPELKKKVGKKIDKSENSVWPKVNLDGPMGSLFKCNDELEFEKFICKHTSGDVVASYKADGSSIEVIYENGELVRGASRGDGLVGDDITPNIRKFVRNKVVARGKLRVRGEAVLLKENFAKYFAGDKNPRNSAAGSLRRLDGARVERLTFLAFDIEGDDYQFKTKAEKFKALSELGFQTTLIANVNKLEDALQIFRHAESIRSTLPYEIDGIVFEENDLQKAEEAGVVDNRPKASIAFKFAAESAECTLLDVQWQIGKTGAITPVGIIAPSNIGGVTITRVMLNNLTHIRKDLKLTIGATAKLIRANDVIPKIVHVVKNGNIEINPPADCPSCNTKLNLEDDMHIFCPNHEECPAQTAYRITHFLSVLDVKGIGDSIVEKLMDANVIQGISDLYRINLEAVASVEGVSAVNVQKAYKDLIQKSKKVTLPKFIKSISIKNIGASATEKVMEKFPTIQDMFRAKVEDLVTIDGIGDSVATDFVFGLHAKKAQIEELLQFITISSKSEGPMTGKTFCFTGFRSSELQEKIESQGGAVSSSVTKATTHLVCVNTESLSTKAKKARDEGKLILSKAELEEMLG
jgi:DNA ligase (NAD+)